jgi:two-component system, sensor histidine kinase and response regulator
MAKLSIFVKAILSAFLALLVTGAFEVAKDWFYPRLTMPRSHVLTILFVAVFIFALSLLISRRQSTHLKRLDEEKANFETLIEHMPGLACILDEDKRLVRWNSRFQNALGYSSKELSGMLAPQTIAESYRELVPRRMGAAWKTGTAEMEAAWLTKDGRHVPCYLTAVRIVVEDRPCILSVGIDISKRKRAEEALRKSEESYRRLLANLPDVTWTTEQTGRTTYMSPNVKEMFGYTAEEFCKGGGELWFSRIHPADLERVQRAFQALFEGNDVFSVEYRIQCRDGRWIWAHDRAIRTHVENGVIFADGVFSDVTERKRAEQAASQLASIVDSSSDAIIGKNPDGTIVSWNPAAVRIFGYSVEEAVEKHVSMLIAPERMHEMRDVMNRIVRGEHVDRFDSVCLRKDGSRFDASLAVSPIMDKTGTVLGISTIANDISLRKRAEREMLRAKEAAEDVARSKTESLANISQELRTPMNVLLGMTELVLDTQLDAEQREYLLIVQSSANSLLRLVDDLLDLSKTESSGLQLSLMPFNLPETIRQTIRPLFLQAQQIGLEISCQIHPSVPDTLIGDVGRLRQVLVNLVGNAIKFTQRGTITVRAHCTARDVQKAEVFFSISDTGIGIPLDRQPTIFEPATQGNGGATRKHGGKGLGLAISSRLVELMGGKLSVDSAPGQGSTFSFSLKFESADRKVMAVQS